MAQERLPIDPLREIGLVKPQEDSFGLKLAIAVTEPFQQLYSLVGAKQPWQRLALGFSLASVVLFLSEPRFAFDEQGNPRPWKLTDSRAKNATLIHWSIPALGFGLASAVFI